MQTVTQIFALFILVFLLWIFYISQDLVKNDDSYSELAQLSEQADRLERLIKYENDKVKKLEAEIAKLQLHKDENVVFEEMVSKDLKQWKEPIPVLVFSCNRASAVRDHVSKLLRYRPSKELFPIIVSQDCDNEGVKNEVTKFGANVQYIKHIAGDKANITIPLNHRQYTTYYRIARHYKLALDYVFLQRKYTSVIITEDDLDIAPDFFSYFSSTRYLLENDPKLWCVTAWNDNGKPEIVDMDSPAKLYRSDFFAGLGWMMTKKTWQELGPIWPVGFWDDWMRDPIQRKDRQCIRPEISRTGMTTSGKEGASKGQFFNKHLIRIKINDHPVDFNKLNLDYLLPANFAKLFENEVMKKAKEIGANEIAEYVLKPENKGTSVRITYDANLDYIQKADKLHVMHDFKAGVPRTAYDGVVTCFINGIRIYLVPDRTKVPGYDPNWSVPASFGD